MKESHLRSIVKAISWRLFGSLSTIAIAFVLTRKLDLSLYIGLIEFVTKVGLFYFHERLWNIISFGFVNIPEDDMSEDDVVTASE